LIPVSRSTNDSPGCMSRRIVSATFSKHSLLYYQIITSRKSLVMSLCFKVEVLYTASLIASHLMSFLSPHPNPNHQRDKNSITNWITKAHQLHSLLFLDFGAIWMNFLEEIIRGLRYWFKTDFFLSLVKLFTQMNL